MAAQQLSRCSRSYLEECSGLRMHHQADFELFQCRGNLLLDCTTYDGKEVCFPEGGDAPEQCAPVQTPVTAALSALMQGGQVGHCTAPLTPPHTLAAAALFAMGQTPASPSECKCFAVSDLYWNFIIKPSSCLRPAFFWDMDSAVVCRSS